MTPRTPLLLLTALCAVPFAVAAVYPAAASVGAALTVLLLLAAVLDVALSPPLSAVRVEREAGAVFSVGVPNPVALRLTNTGAVPIALRVNDAPPAPGHAEGLPATADLAPGRTAVVRYHAVPHRRGRRSFGTVFLESPSRWGLWLRHARHAERRTVRVYPDVRAVRAAELLARQNRLAQSGVRLSRLRGRGTEFDRLRGYVRGDERRAIDWKATARSGELISREYTVEKNQGVLLLLDAGRSMCNATDGVTHFDRALGAALLLAHAALSQGDTVGLLAVSDRVERWLPPVRTPAGAKALARHTYDLEPRYAATDYGLMVSEVRRRHRRRSLVVLLTHAADDVQLDTLARQVRPLRSPHLVLVALVANEPLAARARAVPADDRDAFRVAAAAELLDRQAKQTAALARAGVLVLESLPADLSTAVVSRYLEVKARHLL